MPVNNENAKIIPSHLGFGFLWAVNFSGFQSVALFPDATENPGIVNEFFMISVTVSIVSHFILAFSYLKHPQVLANIPPIAIACLLSLGYACVGLSALLGEAQQPVLVAGSFIHGITYAWLNIMWIGCFSLMPSEQSSISIVSSFTISIPLYFFITLSTSFFSLPGTILSLILITVSGFALDRSLSLPHNSQMLAPLPQEFPSREARQIRHLLWPLVLSACVLSLVYAFTDWVTVTTTNHFILVHQIALALCFFAFLILLIYIRTSKNRVNVDGIVRVSLILIAIGCLLLPCLDGLTQMWTTILVALGYNIFDCLVHMRTAEISYEHRVCGSVVYGFVRGAIVACFGIGALVGFSAKDLDMNLAVIVMISIILLYLVAVAASTIHRRKRLPYDIEDTSADEIINHDSFTSEYSEAYDRKITYATNKYGLTRREIDVFILLARGRSLCLISEELMLS